MFGNTKCLIRTSRYVQSRSIRKPSQVKYSVRSVEGVTANVKLKNHISNLSASAEEPCGIESESLKYEHDETLLKKLEYTNAIIADKKIKLNGVVKRAEELLGCRFYKSRSSPIGVGILNPVDSDRQPYFNLLPDWFQSDTSSINSEIPSLLDSGHPILKLYENIKLDAEEHALVTLSNNIQWRALVIMLVAKAFGHSSSLSEDTRLVEARQITLSEIAEMMQFAFSLHRTVVEINRIQPSKSAMEKKESSLHLGNKIAVLFGDLLLARTSKGLSSLKNAQVTELMSDAISDRSESEILRRRQLDFFKPVLKENSNLFKKLTGHKSSLNSNIELPSYESWRKITNLDLASLIGRSCLCSTLLSQLDKGANDLAFNLGRNIGLVMQAYSDLEMYIRDRTARNPVFDPCTLPVIFYLNSNSVDRIHQPSDISEMYHNVMASPVALLKTQHALEVLKEESLLLIAKLPRTTSAPQILEDFISTLSS